METGNASALAGSPPQATSQPLTGRIVALLAGLALWLSRFYWMIEPAPSRKIKNALNRFDPVE